MRKSKVHRLNMDFNVECELEIDGRWIAEIPQLQGVMTYGETKNEAKSKAETLALEVQSERAKL